MPGKDLSPTFGIEGSQGLTRTGMLNPDLDQYDLQVKSLILVLKKVFNKILLL